MTKKSIVVIILIILVTLVVAWYFALEQNDELSQEISNELNVTVLYPPTPKGFGCNPYGGIHETQQGIAIQNNTEWENLYHGILKGCSVKTNAPEIIDFDKQTLLAVFAGASCSATKIAVSKVNYEDNKVIVHSEASVQGCALPSIAYPLTLVVVDKIYLPVEFTFESIQ